MEFVMCVPLMALIIGLTYFFGFAMRNQQRVRVASRYQAWRRVHPDGRPRYSDSRWLTLNEMFFGEAAEGVSAGGGSGPDDSLHELVEATDPYGPQTADLAEALVMDHFPRGAPASVSAHFPTRVVMWQKFQGAINQHHIRDGVEWRRGQMSYLEPIKDQFLEDLDDVIQGIDHAELRNNLRALYLKQW
jgi:hypothetical protein